MMASERYLFCHAGGYAFLLRANLLRRIWARPAPSPDEFKSVEPIDLRERLGGAAHHEGIALGLEMADGAGVLLVDRIGRFSDISEDEFLALPATFAFASEMFDAACRRSIEDAYPLRLKLET